MAGCKTENWTVKDLSDALQNNHKDGKRIVVPMFQRGQRWKKNQQQTFIDSLIKGYPVGTLLFYEKYEDNQWNYILVDGLQRGNCIRNYMTNPTEFFYDDNISDKTCEDILSIIGDNNKDSYIKIKNLLTEYIKKQKSFKNIQFFDIACQICKCFSQSNDYDKISKIISIITDFFEDKQNLYESISATNIPVNVYSGPEDTLPDIFERINSKGTPLDQYEIYAASWPQNNKFYINNTEIVEYVIKKYDTLIDDGYAIHNYNKEDMRSSKRLNSFEYLFGLSKYLVNKYDILSFSKNITDDTVNPFAYELTNACLNDTDRIRILYKSLENIDINAFEKALTTAIDFVADSISVITNFKGNSRNTHKIFHSKYQIISMISTIFKEMYHNGDYTRFTDTWTNKKDTLSKSLIQYYIYDIITKYWSEGGASKIHAVSRNNRYASELSGRTWAVALDSFFEKSMQRTEKKNVPNPKSEEFVILNCIYAKTFTAMDQLSIDKFDIEHIAPKEQMRKLIESCNGEGLPISCIANLCYLPESTNRRKGAKNFYQDKKYLSFIDLKDVENKYSFTDESDLEWMDVPYDKHEDFLVLRDYYNEYLTKRFEKLKHLFCEALNIPYVSLEDIEEKNNDSIVISSDPHKKSSSHFTPVKFADKCVQRLAELTGDDLIKLSRGSFKTSSNEIGYVITTSKAYVQGKREKFWFAYRRNSNISNCKNQYYIFGCKDETTMIKLPILFIEENLHRLNISTDEEGNITHWHIVIFKAQDNHMTMLFSKPSIEEINIDNYRI